MRTTLDIEDDLLRAAKELAQREGSTVGQVISVLARRGLAGQPAKSKRFAGMRNACLCSPRAAKW